MVGVAIQVPNQPHEFVCDCTNVVLMDEFVKIGINTMNTPDTIDFASHLMAVLPCLQPSDRAKNRDRYYRINAYARHPYTY